MNIRRLMFLNCFWLVAGEVFTSASNLESLVSTEASLLKMLDSYILSQEKEINQLKRAAGDFRREVAKSEASQFMSNPLNEFKIIRRFVRDWSVTRFLIARSGAQDEARRKWRDIERTMIYPNEEDLEKAAAGLIRSQDVCDINATSLANGALPGARNRSELTAAECLELGAYSYSQLNYQRATQWFGKALARYKTENERTDDDNNNKSDLSYLKNTLEWKIYDFLPLSIFYEGKKESALNLTKEIINGFSGVHEGAWNCRELIEKAVARTNKSTGEMGEEKQASGKQFESYLMKRYESLCRGALSTHVSLRSKLKCRYVITSPFTKLARLKEEEAYLNPRIVVFRNVLHDSEIEHIKQLITPKLRRGIVAHSVSGAVRTTSHRIVKQRVILSNESEIVEKIQQRAGDMSRMSTESAEEVNVVNYGLGGHYSLHFDHATPYVHGAVPMWDGNRIATLLFYLSDVEEGGGTAFPALNLTIRPEKGSAVMWRDLLYNGEGDRRMVHAACPVSKGSKWVITVFLHTVGNEFLQPCTLNKHE